MHIPEDPQAQQHQWILTLRKGDAMEVHKGLLHGMPADTLLDNGLRPLHVCAMQGHGAACRVLIRHGANVDAQDGMGLRPLERALPTRLESAMVLLEMGAQLDPGDVRASQLLHTLCAHAINTKATQEKLEFLLKKSIPATSRDEDGVPLLHVAARRGGRAWCNALLDAGADLQVMDSRGATVLHAAARNDNDSDECVRWIASCGLDVNAVDFGGQTPLHAAAIAHRPRIFVTLLELGADAARVDAGVAGAQGLSALQRALAGPMGRAVMGGLALAEDFPAALALLRHDQAKGAGAGVVLPATRLEAAVRCASQALLLMALDHVERDGLGIGQFQHEMAEALVQAAQDRELVKWQQQGGPEQARLVASAWLAQRQARATLDELAQPGLVP